MTTFTCTECETAYTKWVSKCGCGAYGTIHASTSVTTSDGAQCAVVQYEKQRYRSQLLSEVKPETHKRISTGLNEFDHVLSDGIVPGSVALIGGDPGVGKSTLIMQAIANIAARSHGNVLYISGEESESQIATRTKRLHLNTAGIRISREVEISTVFRMIRAYGSDMVVIDSIQTVKDDSIKGFAGSLAQVKRCAIEISKYAKAHKVTFVIVCHVSKDGSFAGPKALEHFVDTVLYFQGDEKSDKRVLQVTKNRYGSTNRFGVFKMTERGLIGE